MNATTNATIQEPCAFCRGPVALIDGGNTRWCRHCQCQAPTLFEVYVPYTAAVAQPCDCPRCHRSDAVAPVRIPDEPTEMEYLRSEYADAAAEDDEPSRYADLLTDGAPDMDTPEFLDWFWATEPEPEPEPEPPTPPASALPGMFVQPGMELGTALRSMAASGAVILTAVGKDTPQGHAGLVARKLAADALAAPVSISPIAHMERHGRPVLAVLAAGTYSWLVSTPAATPAGLAA